ncbi:Phosphoglucomutase-2 [Coelomomyces lativittatus]|nr:Phosphoglucomutase-2 [Coelomomyces lativittatus]KAJ1511948.1 Phosphoglucomutase-2 [Coelomomyces lativittatus]
MTFLVTGPYAHQLFVKELGLPDSSVMRANPLPDFGGGHPDPNLTYAHDLVTKVNQENIHLGAASDGDGDRNMIVASNHTFVNPCDSIALIAVWAQSCIPYFQYKHGGKQVKGVARSMPTSRALDKVAHHFQWKLHEVPTGWKFFGNLMDADQLSLCGEESFGTGSDHIREKDGLWAVLAWLSLLMHHGPTTLVSVQTLLNQHYLKFGRHYYMRYDFEDIDPSKAHAYATHLQSLCTPQLVGQVLLHEPSWKVQAAGDFDYHDPVDGSWTQHQGLYLQWDNEDRVVFRLSGTGSQNATLRLYFEKYETQNLSLAPQVALKALIQFFFKWTQFVQFIGTDQPTVMT